MANDKKFVVKKGLATPNVDFANGGGSISATFLSTSNTLSFSGNTGQLFSITDSMSGTIFSVNDISGIPSIEVIDTGSVKIAETFGTVAVGANTLSNYKFYVSGNTLLGNTTFNNSATLTNNNRLAFNTLNGNSVYMIQQSDDNFVLYTTTPTGSSRAVFAVYANTNTSNLNIVIPLQISNTVVANSSTGTAGQVLTSSGSGVYWSNAGGSANNATYLDGRTWATPFAIGSTVANTGAFTTLTSSGATRIGQSVTQADPSATDILSTAHVSIGGQGSNYLTFGQYSTFGQWIQSSFTNPTTASYNIALNPLGGNVSIGSATAPTKLYVNGHMSVANGFGIYANGVLGANGLVLTSNGTSLFWGSTPAGGFTGNTVSANSTIIKNQSYNVNAAAGWVNMTMPSTVATGDIFIVHSLGGNTRILNNSINIMDVGSGNDLVLENGQTVWLQAVNATAVDVLFTYPAGGTPAVVANSTFATTANNSLFANSASFVYGKQESQLSVAASNTALYLQNRTWETAGAIGATVANTGAFTTVSTTGDIQQQNANYLRGRNSSGTSTRLFGVNNANTVYVGGIDLPLGATLFVNNGVEHMRIESSGNVSIGSTATPTKLFVNGHMSVANGFGIYANGTLGANGLILTSNGTSLFWGSVSAAANATFSTTANNALFANSASFVYGKQESQLSVALAANATFATTANNSLFSNSASFVYGKQESQLSVAIAANSGFAATANNSLFSNSASFAYGKQESQLSVALAANATFATTANNSLFSNSASFVYGKQESQLSVANSAALQGATWQAPLGIGTVTANTGAFTSLTASANVNLDSGTLFVDATNNRVGIGNTNPSFAFQVDGDALFASETIGLRTRFISGKSSPTSAAGPLYLQFNSSNPVHVGGGTGSADFYVPNGNVAIGATAAPTKLFVNGHMSVANGFGIYANGVLGTAGFVLTSNGSSLYWANASSISGTVTSANNSTFAYGKQESQLSVANAVFATTANNSLFSNSASFVYGKQESQLSVANAVYAQSSNSANFANAAAWLGGFQSSYYTNATNITTGTLAEARLPFRMNQNVRTTDDVTFANGTFTGTVSINGSLILTGNLVSTNIQSLSVIDPIIKLAANNSADTLWTGFVSHYEGSGNTTNHTGLLRNPSSKEYLLISTYGDELSVNNNIILTNDTSLTYANLAVRTLRLGNTSSTGYLDANSYSGNANNSTFSYGKQESQLSVANAVYATTAGSVLAGNVSGTVANANNASFLNGRIWETAGAIGSTVANTGAFTTLTASANVNIDSGTLFVDGTSNRVGVNITTPLHAHHVSGSVLAAGDASSVAYYMNDSQAIRSSGTMYIDADTSGQNGFTRAGTGDLIFRTAAAQERMRIISGGNIGIANTTPGQRLQVDGSVGIKNGLVANGTFGTSGQVLTSNGTVIYWANTSAGGFTGNTVSANATIVKNQSYYVNAAAGWVNMTMPSAVVAGDIFIVHSETGNTRILNNSINIMNVGSGNDLLLESGQTVWVQAVNTSAVGIMFTYPAGGAAAIVANSSFATNANNSLFSNSASFAYGKQESQLNVSTANNSTYLQGRIWETAGAIGATVANTGAFTSLTASANVNIDSGTLFVDGPSNRVGVGTATPLSRFHVGTKVADDNTYVYDGNTAMVVHQQPTSTTVLNDPKETLLLARQGTGGQAYGAAASFDLSRYENNSVNSRTRLDIKLAHASFLATPTIAMTLLSSGKVGIGTTNPQTPLVVSNAGAGGLEFDTNGLIQSYNRNTSAYQNMLLDGAEIVIRPSGTEAARVTASGNVAIGSTTAPTKLYVNGHMSVANGFGIYANGVLGANGLVLTSNGTSLFWGSVSSGTATTANNASFLNGRIWETAGAIGSATANTGAFTTLSASANTNLNGNTIFSTSAFAINPTFKAYREAVGANTVSTASTVIDLSTFNVFNLSMTLNTTVSFTNPPASGTAYSFMLYCKQDGVGSRTITWPASVKWPNSSPPTMSTGANKIDVFNFFTLDGGTTYLGALSLANTG